MSGWDGEALGLDEIAHRNIYGDDPSGYRPAIGNVADELTAREELEQSARNWPTNSGSMASYFEAA